MSDSGRQIGDCKHGNVRERCLECWSAVLAELQRLSATHADDLCWMPAEVNGVLAAAGLPPQNLHVGDKAAMLKNCERYIGCLQSGGDWKAYAELESEVKHYKEFVNDMGIIESMTRAECSDFVREQLKKGLAGLNWRLDTDQESAAESQLRTISELMEEGDALRMVHQEARELIGEADATGTIPQANIDALRALLWRASIKQGKVKHR